MRVTTFTHADIQFSNVVYLKDFITLNKKFSSTFFILCCTKKQNPRPHFNIAAELYRLQANFDKKKEPVSPSLPWGGRQHKMKSISAFNFIQLFTTGL